MAEQVVKLMSPINIWLEVFLETDNPGGTVMELACWIMYRLGKSRKCVDFYRTLIHVALIGRVIRNSGILPLIVFLQ